MKKLGIAALLLSATMLAACSSTTAETAAETVTDTVETTEVVAEVATTEESAAVETDDYYPVTITTYNYAGDQIEMTFEQEPERVYACYQNNIETMLALGLGDKIYEAVGLDGDIAEDLADAFAEINYAEGRLKAKEEVVAMQPDLILGWYSVFSDTNLGEVDYWNENGTNTYISLNSGVRASTDDPTQTIDHEMQDILNIGIIFNKQEEAQALVDEVYAEIDNIKAYLETADQVGTAILEGWDGEFLIYGADKLGGSIATSAGAVLDMGADGSYMVGAEDIIVADPETIFLIEFGSDANEEETIAAIAQDPAMASLQAVQNDKIFSLNLSYIYCSGLRCKDGVLQFAQGLYPELYQ